MSYFARVKPNPVNALTTQAIVGATTTTGVILAANANRLGGWVKNISDTDIVIAFGATAALGAPTVLSPGDRYDLSKDTWVYTGAIAAIHGGSGTKNLEVVQL